jgi:hypothetical protein
MPGGPSPLGFAYFVGVKLVGYTVAAVVLKRSYANSTAGTLKVGAIRTAIGVGAGLAYGGLWFLLADRASGGDYQDVAYIVGLIPIRIAEWSWLIHLFFDARLRQKNKAIRAVVGGTIWSYCLDAIGIAAAFVIPGGFWVC